MTLTMSRCDDVIQVEGFCEEPDVHCNYEYGHSLGRGAWRYHDNNVVMLSAMLVLVA